MTHAYKNETTTKTTTTLRQFTTGLLFLFILAYPTLILGSWVTIRSDFRGTVAKNAPKIPRPETWLKCPAISQIKSAFTNSTSYDKCIQERSNNNAQTVHYWPTVFLYISDPHPWHLGDDSFRFSRDGPQKCAENPAPRDLAEMFRNQTN
jgi:hypothetical protein